MRRKLRDRIRTIYGTQDKCAYELGIDSAILSRIISETKDPTESQMGEFCNYLNLTREEVNRSDEKENGPNNDKNR